MKPPEITEDVRETLKIYPYAFCCSDTNGYYITNEGVTVGEGKSPTKAWRDAADTIHKLRKKKRKGKATRP